MSETSENAVLTERRGRVLVITMNRPKAKNAINGALSLGLANAIQELDSDNSLTAGVLTGSGGAFCAGMDLKAFARGEDMGNAGDIIREGSSKPLVAAIEGFALAGGCELALTCDLLVAANNAQLGLREVKVGLFAAGGGLLRLGARVGLTKALEMALTGDSLSAEEALKAGLLSEVSQPGEAVDVAISWAERIAKNAPLAVAASKLLVRTASQGYDEKELWELQAPLQEKIFTSNDGKEGPAAFAEKREPNWSGT